MNNLLTCLCTGYYVWLNNDGAKLGMLSDIVVLTYVVFDWYKQKQKKYLHCTIGVNLVVLGTLLLFVSRKKSRRCPGGGAYIHSCWTPSYIGINSNLVVPNHSSSGYTLELYSYIYSKLCIEFHSILLRLAIYLLYTNFCTGWDGLYVGHQRANFGPQQINYDS